MPCAASTPHLPAWFPGEDETPAGMGLGRWAPDCWPQKILAPHLSRMQEPSYQRLLRAGATTDRMAALPCFLGFPKPSRTLYEKTEFCAIAAGPGQNQTGLIRIGEK